MSKTMCGGCSSGCISGVDAIIGGTLSVTGASTLSTVTVSDTLSLTNVTPATNVFYIANTSDSTSVTTGAGVINGGLGVGGHIYSGGIDVPTIDDFTYGGVPLISSGVWTPTLTGVGGAGSMSFGYTTQTGTWYRIGDLVTVTCSLYFNYTANTKAGVVISNPPFSPADGVYPATMCTISNCNLTGLTNPIQVQLVVDANLGDWAFDFSNGNTYFSPQALGAANQEFNFSMTYRLQYVL